MLSNLTLMERGKRVGEVEGGRKADLLEGLGSVSVDYNIALTNDEAANPIATPNTERDEQRCNPSRLPRSAVG
jgi:hypothetical protein